MLNRYSVCRELCLQLCHEGSENRVFGRRFNGDRRYVIRPHAFCGNNLRDETIVTIGDIQLSVTVKRVPNEGSQYKWYQPIEFSVALTDGHCKPIESSRYTHMCY